jgi:poly(hydroxyalkanoate) depolymerase family esterase
MMIKQAPLHDVLEAARLTRAGRLQEATALLQRALGGASEGRGPAAQANDDGDVIDVPFKEVDGDRDGAASADLGNAQHTARATVASSDHRDSQDHQDHQANQASTPKAQGTAQAQRPAADAGAHAPSSLASVLRRFGVRSGSGMGHATASQADHVDHGPGRFIRSSFTNAAGTREYRLYVPSSYAGEAMPLIVMLHGCKQSPEDFAAGTRMNLIAEKKGCLVLYPAQSTQANPSGCWNWFKREEQAHGRGEPSILAGMVREVMAHWAVDAGRVSVAGLSAGGAMAAVLAVTYPELFAAVGIHSGLACGAAQDLPSALAAMRGMPPMPLASDSSAAGAPMPTIVFHGDRDHTVHPSNGKQVGEHVLRAASAKHGTAGAATEERGQAPGGHPYTRTMHRDAAGNAVLEHWVVHGGGHAWFGGSTAGSYCDPRGPDASEEISRFLLARAR